MCLYFLSRIIFPEIIIKNSRPKFYRRGELDLYDSHTNISKIEFLKKSFKWTVL